MVQIEDERELPRSEHSILFHEPSRSLSLDSRFPLETTPVQRMIWITFCTFWGSHSRCGRWSRLHILHLTSFAWSESDVTVRNCCGRSNGRCLFSMSCGVVRTSDDTIYFVGFRCSGHIAKQRMTGLTRFQVDRPSVILRAL